MSSKSTDEADGVFVTASSIDDLYSALAASRRLYIVSYLQNAEPPVELETLARQLAEWEVDQGAATISDETVEQVCLSLYHVHIPTLLDVHLVHYDENKERLTKGEGFDVVESLPTGIDTDPQ